MSNLGNCEHTEHSPYADIVRPSRQMAAGRAGSTGAARGGETGVPSGSGGFNCSPTLGRRHDALLLGVSTTTLYRVSVGVVGSSVTPWLAAGMTR